MCVFHRISFHSGFDFGYLLKILTASPLPSKEDDFLAQLQLYFPCIYDMKVMMDSCSNLHGGLSKIAELLHVIRIGPQHQAGSDSLLTAATFFKMRQVYFNNDTHAQWAETPQNRNGVRREQRLAASAATASQQAAQTGPMSYSVITNTDSLSVFDTKFLGVLFGLNNEWTESWKKRAETDKRVRRRREGDIAAGKAVSDSDDDDDHYAIDNSGSSSSGHASASASGGGGGSKAASTANNSTSASPSFRPGQGGQHPPYLPMTPQKQQHPQHPQQQQQQHHHEYGQHHGGVGKSGGQKNNTPLHHRSRYSHDYS